MPSRGSPLQKSAIQNVNEPRTRAKYTSGMNLSQLRVGITFRQKCYRDAGGSIGASSTKFDDKKTPNCRTSKVQRRRIEENPTETSVTFFASPTTVFLQLEFIAHNNLRWLLIAFSNSDLYISRASPYLSKYRQSSLFALREWNARGRSRFRVKFQKRATIRLLSHFYSQRTCRFDRKGCAAAACSTSRKTI